MGKGISSKIKQHVQQSKMAAETTLTRMIFFLRVMKISL
jgi:hypothetical protein